VRDARCRWCGRRFEITSTTGRPRTYCRRSCRQRDYEARRRAVEVGLDESQVVIARRDVDALHDRLYELESAIEDVDNDLANVEAPGGDDYRQALEWLLATARPLTKLRLGEQSG
jgi:hypothetical protein